jgi:hypothetical protein
MSKAAGFFEPGDAEVVRLVEVPDPEAGPGQARVRVRAAGVQPFDVVVVAGIILRQAAGVLTGIPIRTPTAAGSGHATRTAPAKGRPEIETIRTTSPVRGAWTIRLAPRYIPMWCLSG